MAAKPVLAAAITVLAAAKNVLAAAKTKFRTLMYLCTDFEMYNLASVFYIFFNFPSIWESWNPFRKNKRDSLIKKWY